MNLGVRYEYFGPQTKSEPKYDSNFYYGDPNVSVEHEHAAARSSTVSRPARRCHSNESPIGALWKSGLEQLRAAGRIRVGRERRRPTSVRGGYGMGYERNFGNVTYNVLFNPPQYLVASIDAPTRRRDRMPIFVDNAGPFGGVAGVTKTIPGGSLRHVDQNIETAYAHFYGAVAPEARSVGR